MRGRTSVAYGLNFIRPGKPIENAYIESFNGRFRDECLNEHWFLTMAHARRVIEAMAYRVQHRAAAQFLGSFLLHTSRAIFAEFLTFPEKVLDTDVCVA